MKAAGKFLKRQALSLFFLGKIRQSTMRTTAIAFAPVRFAFLIQGQSRTHHCVQQDESKTVIP